MSIEEEIAAKKEEIRVLDERVHVLEHECYEVYDLSNKKWCELCEMQEKAGLLVTDSRWPTKEWLEARGLWKNASGEVEAKVRTERKERRDKDDELPVL